MASPDDALLEQIAQQDAAALSELYDRYAKIIYAIALKSLGSVEESEEVVLDVFAQVWRSAANYDTGKAQVKTWLLMMARSRVLDRLRRLQRSTKAIDAAKTAQIQSAKSGVDPIEDAATLERRAYVKAALQQIPPEQQEVIELAYYKGLSQSEIAAATGLSLGTVKTRMRLGLSKLRAALGTSWE